MSLSIAGRMALADFQERSRRFAFVVTIAISLYAGYAFLPPNQASYVTLRFADHRGIYNSAWVGAAIAMLTAIFVGLAGFYIIKNAIERDRLSRVGQILAATPVSRFVYIFSKMMSNFAVLASIALAMAVSAGITQVVRAEETHVQISKLLAPYLFLTLPSLLFIAAIGVFFECAPGLRGGGGNVAYFFVWGAGMAASGVGLYSSGKDFLGFGLLFPSMLEACQRAFPDYDPASGGMAMGLNFRNEGVWKLSTFVWNGVDWTPRMIAYRAAWALSAVGLVFAASLVFDRFGRETGVSSKRFFGRKTRPAGAAPAETGSEAALPGFAEHYRIAALDPASLRIVSSSHFLRLLTAEVKLLLKGTSVWWWLIVLGLAIASLVAPLDGARKFVLPLLAIWPVLIWSGMGVREARFGTDLVLFSAPHPVRLQIPAAWLGGVCVALLVSGAMLARLALAAEWGAVLAVLAGACFVPALALALGVWTGTSRAFEGLYTAFWYMGPLQPIPAIDYMGASRQSVEMGTPLVFAIVTAVLLALAFLGRRRQLLRS